MRDFIKIHQNKGFWVQIRGKTKEIRGSWAKNPLIRGMPIKKGQCGSYGRGRGRGSGTGVGVPGGHYP